MRESRDWRLKRAAGNTPLNGVLYHQLCSARTHVHFHYILPSLQPGRSLRKILKGTRFVKTKQNKKGGVGQPTNPEQKPNHGRWVWKEEDDEHAEKC